MARTVQPKKTADAALNAALNATQDILRVISESRDDAQPIFDAILKNACDLCEAPMAWITLLDDAGTHITIPAWRGASDEFAEGLKEFRHAITETHLTAVEAMLERKVVCIDDIAATETYRHGDPVRIFMVDVEGIRSIATIPLIRDGMGIGSILLYRKEVDPFTDDDVALVETFAAQAVIAIENVRQFREVQERLEREKASAEILDVISRSRDDEAPVFDIILENAARLCSAPMAGLVLLNEPGDTLIVKGVWGDDDSRLELPSNGFAVDSDVFPARAFRAAEILHIPDMKQVPEYIAGNPRYLAMVEERGFHSYLCVPLMQKGRPIGCIDLFRTKAAPFDSRQIALVETFATQAVIAIENVRQFKALAILNAELGKRVDEQVGEIERMGRLKRFLPAAVAEAVVTSGDESMLTSHRAMVATLFCDIRGFTAFCETAEPEETIEVLQTYHQEMSDLIDDYGGGVDQRSGDGIMVIFNDPIPVDDPAGDAVGLAVAMRVKMKELCAGWKRLGHRLGFGIGISLGYATVGLVGSAGRFDYTASGTSVNTAARLCDMALDGEVLISPRVWVAVEGDFQAESRGEFEIKGIREPVEVFALN